MMMIRSDPSLDWVLATTTTIEGRIEGARSFLPVCYYGACGSRLELSKRGDEPARRFVSRWMDICWEWTRAHS